MSKPFRRSNATDPLGAVPLFADLSSREREQLRSFMTPAHVAPGKVLTEQGSLGREFFIIVEGTASVTRDGEVIGSLGAGDTFGEVALLGDDVLRSATVTATSAMELEVMTPGEMRDMLDRAPHVAEVLLAKIAEYDGAASQATDDGA
jgi:CRP-like cAMP-binding protein